MKTTIPIEIIELEDESYHLMIEATFNKTEKGHLIIDTGASKTVLDSQFSNPFISEFEEIEENQSSGINAMITDAQIGIMPYISLNELELSNYKCLLLDLSHINELYKKYSDRYITGLIGSDFLLKYHAVIDYKKKTLTLSYRKTKIISIE